MNKATNLALLFKAAPFGTAQFGRLPYQFSELDSEAVLVPVLTVVQTASLIVDQTIQEADFDGTPDVAQDIANDLAFFVHGFQTQPSWPQASAAEGTNFDPYVPACDIAGLVAALPERTGHLERNEARRQASSANATTAERVGWARQAWPARSAIQLIQARLSALASQLDEFMGASQPQYAADRSNQWLVQQAPNYQGCLPAPLFFFIRTQPASAWPTAYARIIGGQGTPQAGSLVRITAPSLGLQEGPVHAPVPSGTTVPHSGGPSQHRVHAPAS